MRWLALLIFLTPCISHGVSINQPADISAAITDGDSFRFFYIGHAYGAHNGGGGKKKLAYPHPEIIRLIDHLNGYNFGAFGGDVVEICNKKSVEAFNDFLVKPLGLPLINSIGNHDKCLQNLYDLPASQVFTKDNNTFLIVNSKHRQLEHETIDWLKEQLQAFNNNPDVKRLFIFTHRPAFLLLDPSLKGATGFGNFPVRPDEYFTNSIKSTIFEIDSNKSVYWFGGDLGMRLPYVYKRLNENIHLIGSGVYERDSDHYLDVSINSDTVDIKAVNFLSGSKADLIEYTNPDFIAKRLLPGKAFDEGWTETMLTRLYASVGAGKKITIKAEKIEHDISKAFDLYYLPQSSSILLRKEDCGPSGDRTFYVQFHPVHVKNRRIKARPWNGYHFYATRTGKNDEQCIATFPLPDYPYKFIITGQHSDNGIAWNARINPAAISTN